MSRLTYACEPKRLNWWRTDLVDEEGGGKFFGRLLPKTKYPHLFNLTRIKRLQMQ